MFPVIYKHLSWAFTKETVLNAVIIPIATIASFLLKYSLILLTFLIKTYL